MKRMLLLGLAALSISLSGFAYEYEDDIYYNPKKDNATKNTSTKKGGQYLVDFSTMDVDEYNRRGQYYPTPVDTIGSYVENEPDFVYTTQIQKFYNPTIVVDNASMLDDILNYSYGNVDIVYNFGGPSFAAWSPFNYYNYSWYNPWRWGGLGWSLSFGPFNVGFYDPWYWGPSYSWGWGPSWTWGPSWAWGPGWGWGPSWGWGHNHWWGPSHGPGHIPPRPMATYSPGGRAPFGPAPGGSAMTRPNNNFNRNPANNGFRGPGNNNNHTTTQPGRQPNNQHQVAPSQPNTNGSQRGGFRGTTTTPNNSAPAVNNNRQNPNTSRPGVAPSRTTTTRPSSNTTTTRPSTTTPSRNTTTTTRQSTPSRQTTTTTRQSTPSRSTTTTRSNTGSRGNFGSGRTGGGGRR